MADYRKTFQSLTEFVNYADGRVNDPNAGGDSSQDRGGKSWTGVDTYAEIGPIAFNWEEGAAKVKKMRAMVSVGKRFRPEVIARKTPPGRINVARAIQGHPYAFTRVVKSNEEQAGRGAEVVDIVLNFAASAGVSAETLIMRGAATLALTDALEASGKRVRVTMVMTVERGSHSLTYSVIAKRPEQRLNLNTLAFAMAHPGMLRRLCFAVMEREPKEVRQRIGIPGGYGRPADCPDDLQKGAIYMGQALLGYGSRWNDPEWVKSWIIDQLVGQGVTLS